MFAPTCYILRRLKKRSCCCHLSPPEINEVNTNPLKIFKNFVNYAVPSGKKDLFYSVLGESDGKDQKNAKTFCEFCNEKYRTVLSKYAPCQKIEILDFGEDTQKKRTLINLSQNISACWLIEPFINSVEVGDMICLTAFYFMTPQQKFLD